MFGISLQDEKIGLLAGLTVYGANLVRNILWPLFQKLFVAMLFAAAVALSKGTVMHYMDERFLNKTPHVRRALHKALRVKS